MRWRLPAVLAIAAALAVEAGVRQRDVAGQTANPKLATALADLVSAVPQQMDDREPAPTAAQQPLVVSSLPKAARDAIRTRHLRLNDDNEAQLYVLVDPMSADRLKAIEAAGARIEYVDEAYRRVQISVPISRIARVAALPFVEQVRLPTYAIKRRVGSANTEGDKILNADTARAQFGLDGAGIKVGVISDGINGVFADRCTGCSGEAGGPIERGDLPNAKGVRLLGNRLVGVTGGIEARSFAGNHDLEGRPPSNCAFNGAGAEGTALLEIVHDLAPKAQLAFANVDTDLSFRVAVNFLAANNDVVVDDLGFFAEAYDGTSAVSSNTAAALNNPANRIRTYVTSVGNSADEHYFGRYVDSGVDGSTVNGIANSGRLHLFQPTAETTDVLGRGNQPFNLISMPQGGEVLIFLSWNEPAGRSGSNYDLYLVREDSGAVVARSTDRQNGSQDSIEVIDFVNDDASGLFRILIQNVRDQAPPRDFNVFSFQPQCAADGPRRLVPTRVERHNYNTATHSVTAQSDSGGSPVSVISVGAVCSASAAASSAFPSASCNDRTNSTIEFFSSRGPTHDGRQKPDLVATDGVAITGSGNFPNPFFGTSASAPHVAGQAALLLQAAPCLVAGSTGARAPDTARARLRTLILATARPLSPVPDNIFGAGLADVFASVERAMPARFSIPTILQPGNAPNGAVLRPVQLGFSDPNSCSITSVSVSTGCTANAGGRADSIACPFGTTSAAISASSNDVSFTTPENVQITVTNFALSSSPGTATIAVGQSATYQVTIAATGGAYHAPVTLACSGLPPGATCSFNPATVTPGTTAAVATLTITTAARTGAISKSGVASGALVVVVIGGCAWLLSAKRHRGKEAKRQSGQPFPFAPLPASAHAPISRELWRGSPEPWRRRPLWPSASLLLVALASVSCFGDGGMNPEDRPSVSLSPNVLSFGTQITQTTSPPQTVTVRNTGRASLAIDSIVASGDFTQTSNCGTSLQSSGTCTITVTFKPTANGARTGAITITDNALGSPHTVALTGTGIAPPNGTPTGTFAIVVTGTHGTLANGATVTLIVQ